MKSRTAIHPFVLALAMGAAACTDRDHPVTSGGATPPPSDPTRQISLGELRCVAEVGKGSVVCAPPGGADANQDILYGGQNVFVHVTTANPSYDAGTGIFTFETRVRNLIPQAIGTVDGVSNDPTGIKVFFVMEPTATAGTGPITIDNEDGTGAFTGAAQPYFSYVTTLDQYEQSGVKTWQFTVPNTVSTFAFALLVSSPVQYPTGWIEMTPSTFSLRRTYTKQVSGIVRDQYGRAIPGATISWASGDNALATVDPATGMVSGHVPGAVSIVASSTNDVLGTPGAAQQGTSAFTVMGNAMVWTGAVSTDWGTAGNWDRGVSPTASDSLTIPVVGTGNYPVLAQNEGVQRLIVDDGASLSINAFNLTVNADVSTGLTGGITATTGRVALAGTAKTVGGLVPRLSVTGTYSLSANLLTTPSIRIIGGRLRSTSFRIRAVNN